MLQKVVSLYKLPFIRSIFQRNSQITSIYFSLRFSPCILPHSSFQYFNELFLSLFQNFYSQDTESTKYFKSSKNLLHRKSNKNRNKQANIQANQINSEMRLGCHSKRNILQVYQGYICIGNGEFWQLDWSIYGITKI